jgi:hypothetical protein
MGDTRALVMEAIAATRIHPPARYSWFGAMSPAVPARVLRALSAKATRGYLVQLLAGQLYSDFYMRGRAEPRRGGGISGAAGRRRLASALSAANCGQGFLDGGWQVVATDERGVRVVKHGLELTVGAADFVGTEGDADRVAVRLPKELPAISPGFHMVCGDHPIDAAGGARLVRLYWNLRVDGAVPFVGAATRLLNAAGAAFRLKVVNDPAGFGRCDAGVVYLSGDDYPGLAGVIGQLRAELAGFLSPRTPVFTAELAAGLGFAEDPGTAESFGEHRCRLLAEALVRSHESGWTDAARRLGAVEERFVLAGLDLEAAHRGADPATVQ